MRLVLVVILILAVLAWVGCVVPSPFSFADEAVDLPRPGQAVWRRTASGWERADLWPGFQDRQKAEPDGPPIHPVAMTGLLLAGSLAALVLLDSDARTGRS
jgi:hypothetical protein